MNNDVFDAFNTGFFGKFAAEAEDKNPAPKKSALSDFAGSAGKKMKEVVGEKNLANLGTAAKIALPVAAAGYVGRKLLKRMKKRRAEKAAREAQPETEKEAAFVHLYEKLSRL